MKPRFEIEPSLRESESIATPEDEQELAEIEKQIDGLRQEIQTLTDAIKSGAEASHDRRLAQERPEKKFLGIFRRKDAKFPGVLSMHEAAKLHSTLQTAESQLWKLFVERDALEEKMLDVETIRARGKTRISEEYVEALEETGRAVTSEEKYQMGKGKEYLEVRIDQDMEALKKKRSAN